MSKTLNIKQSKKKEALVEQLKKAPIVQVACERTDVSRATFYRWKKEDVVFAEAVDEALATGSSLINDMAESKLISAIKEGHMTGIIYWLKHHHPTYATRVELSMQQNRPQDELTPEQQTLVTEALALAGVTEVKPDNEKNSQRKITRKNKK